MYLYLFCVLSDKIMKKNISISTIYIFKLLFIQITDRCPMQCRLLIINSDYLNVCCRPRDISLAMYSDYPNVCRLDVLVWAMSGPRFLKFCLEKLFLNNASASSIWEDYKGHSTCHYHQ